MRTFLIAAWFVLCVHCIRVSEHQSLSKGARILEQATVSEVEVQNHPHPWQGTYYLSLAQTVQAPRLTNPVRISQCLDAAQLSSDLQKSIMQLQKKHYKLVQGVSVQTTYYQQEQLCMYTSFISYNGSAEVKNRLVSAVNSADPVKGLCSVLRTYCTAAFPPGSPYTLITAHVDPNPTLPPVMDFACVKHHFNQKLDHFDPSETRTFAQVYWVCPGAWPTDRQQQVREGNVIVFLGNESPLGTPNQPIVFENARRLNALVILVEHRYYGESSPFPLGPNGYLPTPEFKWLMVQNVIEDTSTVVHYVRQEMEVPTEVPAVVIGGSYGGMLATYHRITKPDTFNAAVAASAPILYILGTESMDQYASRCHLNAGTSAQVWSGDSTECGSTIQLGLNHITSMGKTTVGRKKLAKLFKLCADAAADLTTPQAVASLMNDQLFWWEGDYVQVNNQPPLYGQVTLGCQVLMSSYKAAVATGTLQVRAAVQALAAVNAYFFQSGDPSWCYTPAYSPNLSTRLLSPGLMQYAYQQCTQGIPDSPDIPSSGAPGMLSPPFTATMADMRKECQSVFGPEVPEMDVPDFMLDVKQLVKDTGGVVFTNGNLDCWAGGSVVSPADLNGDLNEGSKIATIIYDMASHCTDTHTYMWATPQPQQWRAQRAEAMDWAVQFAHTTKSK